MTTRKRLFIVLGFIFVAAVVGLVIFFRDAKQGYLSVEVAKALLQLATVAAIGTLVSLLLWEYQAEQARLDKERDQAHQSRVRGYEYRDELLTGTLARVVNAYSNAKKARRFLRARVGISPGAPGWVALADYDSCIETVNEAQLELETLKGDVKTSAVAFSRAGDIEKWLESMEQYLGRLVKEYEKNRHLVSKEEIPLRFDQLENLSDFLGKAGEGSGFTKDVIAPYHEVQEAIRESLLHAKLPVTPNPVRSMRQKRILVTRYGGPEVITSIEEDIPVPRAGELRVRVLAAGVSLPDVLAREGVHPETPRVPYTPGWDLVGTVDQLGQGVTGLQLGQTVAAMPIHGCYAQYVCVPQDKVVSVPAGLDAAEAVAVVLNYVTAYQMLHRSAKAQPGQRMLIHGAAGGVGSAMLQLAKLAGVEMYGTCSEQAAPAVRELGGIPIDYKNSDFVKEIHRLTGDGVDAVFDGIGGDHLWRSRDALREGGSVVTYGFQSKMRGGRMASRSEGRHPFRESAELGGFIVRNWFKPGRKSMVPYSIQWMMRLKPAWFRQDLLTLLDLLKQGKIRPVIAQRLPLEEARRAHEMLGEGGVLGKIVLLPNSPGGPSDRS